MMNEVVACWHHGDLFRLKRHLKHGRIDVYGADVVTKKTGQYSLCRFCERMKLQEGENIRIRVGNKIYYTAVIKKTKSYMLPSCEWYGIWKSALDLDAICEVNPPEIADCYPRYRLSHRLPISPTKLK